jgi:hypothetical protein
MLKWWARQGSNLSQVIDYTTSDSQVCRHNRGEGGVKAGSDSPTLRQQIIASLGASIAAVILAAGIVVALDYIYRPVLDGAGNAVALRGSVR